MHNTYHGCDAREGWVKLHCPEICTSDLGKEKTVSELLITELLSVGSGISLAIFTTNVSYAVATIQRQVLSYIFILYLVCFPSPNLFILLLTVHYYCKTLKLNNFKIKKHLILKKLK